MLVTEHKCPCFSPRNRLHRRLRSEFLHFTSKEAVAPVTEKAAGRGLSVKHRLIVCAYKGPQFYTFNPSLKQIQARASSEPLQIKLSVCAGKQSWSCWHHRNHPSLRIHQGSPNPLRNWVGWEWTKTKTVCLSQLPFLCKSKWDISRILIIVRLPWWLSGKESACQCRRHGFGLWSGRIPHATEQLSPCATNMEPVL